MVIYITLSMLKRLELITLVVERRSPLRGLLTTIGDSPRDDDTKRRVIFYFRSPSKLYGMAHWRSHSRSLSEFAHSRITHKNPVSWQNFTQGASRLVQPWTPRCENVGVRAHLPEYLPARLHLVCAVLHTRRRVFR